jgi:integrase
MPKRERGQGSIGRVPESKFYYIWYYSNDGQQHRESSKSTLKQVAQEMLNARLAAMGRGERSPMEVKSVRYEDMREILLHHYMENKISVDKLELDDKGNPTGLNRTGLHLLDEFFKCMPLDRIDTDVLRLYRKSRKCGGTTINRDLALLRRMIVLTVREKKLQYAIPYFPMTSESGNARQGFVEPARFNELRNAMPAELRPLTTFLYTTGCRVGAAKQILWSWVDLDEAIISIPDGVTKNGESIILPIDPALLTMMRKMFRKDGAVFVTVNFRKAFQAACVSVKLGHKTGTRAWEYTGLTPHDLRRSAVRNSVRAGNSETVAMKISGHRTASVFRRYNITSLEDIRKAGKRTADYNARKSASK